MIETTDRPQPHDEVPDMSKTSPFYSRAGQLVGFIQKAENRVCVRYAHQLHLEFWGFLFIPSEVPGEYYALEAGDDPLCLAYGLMDIADEVPEAQPRDWTLRYLRSCTGAVEKEICRRIRVAQEEEALDKQTA